MRIVWSKHGIPHGFLCETPVHLIYRLKGCLPVGPLKVLHEELKDQLEILKQLGDDDSMNRNRILQEYQMKYDELLDAQDQEKYILREAKLAQIVLDSWEWLENQKICNRIAICIMGNHVHALISGFEGQDEIPIGEVLKQHKSFTNHEIRKLIALNDRVWERGYFDRYVREGSLLEVIQYILSNPVKARLVDQWFNWRSTYLSPEVDRATLFLPKGH